jgi:hypothetical protein
MALAVESNQLPIAEYLPASDTFGTQKLSDVDVTSPVTFTSNDAPVANLSAPVLPSGPAVWSNSGGGFLGPSSFSFTLPPPILINGALPLEWSASQSQTLTWNPAGYDSGAILQATFSSATAGEAYAVISTGILGGSPFYAAVLAGATISAPAGAGSLTIPAQLLAQVGSGAATLTVQVTEPFASSPSTLLTQPNGKTLLMLANASSGETLPVDIK